MYETFSIRNEAETYKLLVIDKVIINHTNQEELHGKCRTGAGLNSVRGRLHFPR